MTVPAIRRFRPADAAGAQRVFLDAVLIGAAAHYTPEQLEDWSRGMSPPDAWARWLGGHFCVVGEEDGRIVGFFMLEASGYLNMAFVLPDYRRTGLAGQLYDAILAEAQHQRIPVLTVWASRLFHRFLRRRGWVDDPDPPPLDGHPIDTDDPEPIDYPMKLVLIP